MTEPRHQHGPKIKKRKVSHPSYVDDYGYYRISFPSASIVNHKVPGQLNLVYPPGEDLQGSNELELGQPFEQASCSSGQPRNRPASACHHTQPSVAKLDTGGTAAHPLKMLALCQNDGEQTIDAAHAGTLDAKKTVSSLGYNSLKDCMESVLGELHDASQKLLQWMKQEMQILACSPSANKGTHRSEQVGSEKRDSRLDNGLKLGFPVKKTLRQGNVAHEVESSGGGSMNLQFLNDSVAKEDFVSSNNMNAKMNIGAEKGLDGAPSHCKSEVYDVHPTVCLVDARKNAVVNADLQSPAADGSDQFEFSKASNCVGRGMNRVFAPETKAVVDDMGFATGSGEPSDGLDLCFKNEGNSIKEEFESSKESTGIVKKVDVVSPEHRSRPTNVEGLWEKNERVDDLGDNMQGMDNGIAQNNCSKTSTHPNKSLGKMDQDTTGAIFHIGYSASLREESNEGASLESANNERYDFGFGKGKADVERGTGLDPLESKSTLFDVGFTADRRATSLVEANKQAICSTAFQQNAAVSMVGNHRREKHLDVASGFSMQCSQLGDNCEREDSYVYNRLGFGLQCEGEMAMTFKGSAPVNRHEAMPENVDDLNSAELFNFMTSSISGGKLFGRIPSSEECKASFLSMHNQSTCEMQSPVAVNSMWDILTSRSHTMHDLKVFQSDYGSHSKFVDMGLQSGRTINHALYGPKAAHDSITSHNKSGNGGMDLYQGWTNNTMHPSLCVPNCGPTVGMRFTARQTVPTSSGSYMSALLGAPGQLPMPSSSNLHTFLGLNVNGLPGAASNRHAFPDINM